VKVLLMSRYARQGASTRLRFLQYLPHLEAAGITVELSPLLNDAYLQSLYTGEGRSAKRIIAAYARRLARLFSVGSYSLVWIEKELFPRLPATFERILRLVGVRYVADYDDAVFHDYDLHQSPFVRMFLSRKVDRVMAGATLVVAGNDYLAARAKAAGAERVELLPTVVDLERYTTRRADNGVGFIVGWIGTPMTFCYLSQIGGALQTLSARGSTRVVAVGANAATLNGVDLQTVPWTESQEVAEMQKFDVGIMPLPDGPWERGKCGYKLIQYMACGKPIVASPVGVNSQIVRHGINGFLAQTQSEWIEALQTLRDDPELRMRMGHAGRQLVEGSYCTSVASPRLIRMLRVAARETSQRG
jgi:glycosyltransferase involved in cell wall biosynthesis